MEEMHQKLTSINTISMNAVQSDAKYSDASEFQAFKKETIDSLAQLKASIEELKNDTPRQKRKNLNLDDPNVSVKNSGDFQTSE